MKSIGKDKLMNKVILTSKTAKLVNDSSTKN